MLDFLYFIFRLIIFPITVIFKIILDINNNIHNENKPDILFGIKDGHGMIFVLLFFGSFLLTICYAIPIAEFHIIGTILAVFLLYAVYKTGMNMQKPPREKPISIPFFSYWFFPENPQQKSDSPTNSQENKTSAYISATYYATLYSNDNPKISSSIPLPNKEQADIFSQIKWPNYLEQVAGHNYYDGTFVVTKAPFTLHNEKGPAVEKPDGTQYYFLDGIELTKEQWTEKIQEISLVKSDLVEENKISEKSPKEFDSYDTIEL